MLNPEEKAKSLLGIFNGSHEMAYACTEEIVMVMKELENLNIGMKFKKKITKLEENNLIKKQVITELNK